MVDSGVPEFSGAELVSCSSEASADDFSCVGLRFTELLRTLSIGSPLSLDDCANCRVLFSSSRWPVTSVKGVYPSDKIHSLVDVVNGLGLAEIRFITIRPAAANY